jgi:hypothetical protein
MERRLSGISCEIDIRVTPRSSRNKVEWVGDVLKVWVTAAPTDGQANEAVCQVVAKAIKRPPSSVSVKKGHTSRDKTLAFDSLDREELLKRLTG